VAWAFTIATLIAISVSPVVLRGGVLLAVTALLVPTDPEVFGLPLYTFWWAGLLIVVAALWRPRAGWTPWRLAFVFVGGLSSPIILLVLPLFLCRMVAWRKDISERIVTIAATICATTQIMELVQSNSVAPKSLLSASSALAALPLFFGNYLVGSLGRAHPTVATAIEWTAAIATLALVTVALHSGRRHVAMLIVLLYLLFGSIALSAARVPIFMLDPISAGPRYFFYPFVFEGWFLLQVAFIGRRAIVRSAAAAFVALAALNAVPALSRSHEDLHWLANIATCETQVGDSAVYNVPIEYDGRAASAWFLPLTGGQCRALAASDLLARPGLAHPSPVLPYTVHNLPPAGVPPSSIAAADTVVSNGWNGTDFQHSRLPGFVVVGSYRTADADTGRLTLRLHRGDRVLFRSGPTVEHQRIHINDQPPGRFDTALPTAVDWAVLEFANPRLPREFVVIFEDGGTGWGEWSAVALARRSGCRTHARAIRADAGLNLSRPAPPVSLNLSRNLP